MKKLTVVFPYFITQDGGIKILLGRNFRLNKLNGFGGKAEEGESFLDCAVREFNEEIILPEKISGDEDGFNYIGKVKDGDKEIHFYTLKLFEDKVPSHDLDELYDLAWYDLSDPESFVPEMLSGDGLIISELQKIIPALESFEHVGPFEIDKTGNQELDKQTGKIF